MLTTMYADSRRPRVAFSARSFNQLSVTMYRPDMATPVSSRMNAHAQGSTQRANSRAATDASDAIAAKTRIWPTLSTNLGIPRAPNRKPAK